MARRVLFFSFVLFNSLHFFGESKTLDPYKVLGVDKNASQRDIQKAFHKLSLQYHPDKNKAKGAQEKFAEINNAYEILSDEEKRKNYDLYGDEKPNPGFDGANFGNREGYTYFTTGGSGGDFFSSNPNSWQSTGSQGNTKTFSFSFGGNPSSRTGGDSFGFGFGDIFSSFFNMGMSGGGGAHTKSTSPVEIIDITLQHFNKQIVDQGMTWILLFFTPGARQYHVLETLVEDVISPLNGAVKSGKVNCLSEKSLCQKAGVTGRSARLFIYSYLSSEKGTLVEYTGEFDAKSFKAFCLDHLPKVSKRVDISRFNFPINSVENLPQVILLSTKRDTPVMWRVVSGLFRKRFLFYDAEIHDVSTPFLKRLGVRNLPAIVGRTVDGQEQVLKSGISVRDLKSGIDELKSLLENFEKKNKISASHQTKKPSQSRSQESQVPLLTVSNFDELCGEKVAVCLIGVFRSSKSKENLEKILSAISQKSLIRRQNRVESLGNTITYSLLDATKQSTFLSSFDKSGYKSYEKFLIAYKPRRGRFALLKNEVTMEEAEKFVGSVLNGDVQFSKIRQKPVIR